MKTLIVGGGIAGLAIAWRLARQGAEVELVERGICGRAASWAAAGMLAPGGELTDARDALGKFARFSHAKWPEFAAELERATGVGIGFRQTGSLLVAGTAAEAHSLRARHHDGASWLSPSEITRREPSVAPDLFGGLLFPKDGQVDNRALCHALSIGLRESGVSIRENCDVQSVFAANGRAAAVLSDAGTLEADIFVLACGAWLDLVSLPGVELSLVRPVKGQMVACIPPDPACLPTALIWSDKVYLVPRPDRLLIGATVEDAGFDLSVDAATRGALIRDAARIVPAIANWPVAESWAGLRPQTRDGAPVLGPAGLPGLYVAGGQFRNGILFAPAIADCMAALLRGESAGEFATAFDPLRFAG